MTINRALLKVLLAASIFTPRGSAVAAATAASSPPLAVTLFTSQDQFEQARETELAIKITNDSDGSVLISSCPDAEAVEAPWPDRAPAIAAATAAPTGGHPGPEDGNSNNSCYTITIRVEVPYSPDPRFPPTVNYAGHTSWLRIEPHGHIFLPAAHDTGVLPPGYVKLVAVVSGHLGAFQSPARRAEITPLAGPAPAK